MKPIWNALEALGWFGRFPVGSNIGLTRECQIGQPQCVSLPINQWLKMGSKRVDAWSCFNGRLLETRRMIHHDPWNKDEQAISSDYSGIYGVFCVQCPVGMRPSKSCPLAEAAEKVEPVPRTLQRCHGNVQTCTTKEALINLHSLTCLLFHR